MKPGSRNGALRINIFKAKLIVQVPHTESDYFHTSPGAKEISTEPDFQHYSGPTAGPRPY